MLLEKRALDPVNLELQAVVNYLKLVPGTILRSWQELCVCVLSYLSSPLDNSSDYVPISGILTSAVECHQDPDASFRLLLQYLLRVVADEGSQISVSPEIGSASQNYPPPQDQATSSRKPVFPFIPLPQDRTTRESSQFHSL